MKKHSTAWWVCIGWWWYLCFAWWLYPIIWLISHFSKSRESSSVVNIERQENVRTNKHVKMPALLGSRPVLANKNQILCDCYSVKGKNPNTNRRKTENVVVESTASEEEIQRKSGLLPPYEIKKMEQRLPTEKQIAYAEKLGIIFPPDATIQDASVFLTRNEEDIPLIQPPAPDTLIRYLISKDIYVPAYAGVAEVSALYLNGISNKEKTAFFCMRVFCCLKKKSHCLLEDAPQEEQSLFFEFADLHETDADFMRSLSHYSAADISLIECKPLKKLKAYDIAANFIMSKQLDWQNHI